MVGTRWRLTYTDSGGTKRTIAELGQDTGAKKIDHMRYILKRKNPWIMKVFTDPSVLKAFPNEVSEYQSDEPEILFEEYDSGWTTRGRFYSASQTQEDNEFAIQLLDFYHKVMNQEASVTSTTTNIVDAMAKALPAGYVLDTPDEVDVTGGYPSVDNYSAQNTQVRKVYRELTRDNNWALFFLPEQDGSGDWKVRFEPDGFGGTVNSYDTSIDNVTIKQWQPPRKRNLITKTLVEGVDSSGSKITATAENTTIRDKYLGTRSTDHNFKSYKVGYLESQSEADKIAENRLVPGPNATTVKDQGILKDTIYVQDVVNDSFGLTDNFRGINDTFTCVKQENFYPSNTSYLHLEFESEELEKAAEGQENLRDERARLYPKSTTQETVGPLNIDDTATDTEEVSEQYDADQQNNHDHGNSNVTSDVGQIASEGQETADDLFFSVSDGASNSVTINDVNYDGNQFVVDYILDTDAGFGAEFIVQIQLAESGTILKSYVTKTNNGGNIEGIVSDQRNADGEDIEFLIVNKSGSSVSVNTQQVIFVGEQPHDHFVNLAPTDGDTADLTINVNTSDSTAGDTSQLTVSGQTLDEIIDIITTQEDKTDR